MYLDMKPNKEYAIQPTQMLWGSFHSSPILYCIIYTGYDDFDSTPIYATFPSVGASVRIISMKLNIPIIADDIDEADQVFIIFLEVVNAINSNNITSFQNVSICRIINDESKY